MSAIRTNHRRYAFVVPRFAEGLAGGAETLVGNLAAHLAARGNPVEIFTTCAKDNRTWENHFPEGKSKEFGLVVHRFPVDERNLDSWIPKQISICDGLNLSLDDQLEWMAESVNSTKLYKHILNVADDFDAIYFAPYLFGTTFWGALLRPDKAYLIPCLHDEHYAYTDVIASMFRQVSGALFNASPEQELAGTLFGDIAGGEVGMGFDLYPEEEVQSLKPYFQESFPYLLYFGRKETGKNVQLLIDYFIALKDKHKLCTDLKLVIFGGGDFSDLDRASALLRDDIIDLGHMSEQDKRRLVKYAHLICQPSINESFSIVLMEAWMLEVPVLVHADCSVTKHHVVESGGGLFFSSEDDFVGVLSESFNNRSLRSSMAKAGREYVEQKYSWEAVLERFDNTMDTLLSREHERRS